jgi:hypothetical protein
LNVKGGKKKMKSKIIAVSTLCMLMMLVISSASAIQTNDVEFHIYSGRNGGNVGTGVTYEANNNGEEPVNVTFIFYPICFRSWSQLSIEREVQPHDTVKETFYFPIFSAGLVLTHANYNSSNYIERLGYHIGQLVFLNPVI